MTIPRGKRKRKMLFRQDRLIIQQRTKPCVAADLTECAKGHANSGSTRMPNWIIKKNLIIKTFLKDKIGCKIGAEQQAICLLLAG